MTTDSHDDAAPRPVGHEQLAGTLDVPVLSFNLPAEIDHLHKQSAWTESTGPSSTTLVKHADLRVVLVAMRAGTRMPEHRTAARVTLEGLSGRVRVLLARGGVCDLPEGHLLVLDREIVHDVEALEDSAFLLTLAWPNAESAHDPELRP
jgi:quercetin dioxygenase-like cupin family protein